MLQYFDNIVCPFWANHLDDVSIKAYLDTPFGEFKEHHRIYQCWCFKCRIFKLLFDIVVGRIRSSQFLIESDFKICFAHTTTRKKPYSHRNSLMKLKNVQFTRMMKHRDYKKAQKMVQRCINSLWNIHKKKDWLMLIFFYRCKI